MNNLKICIVSVTECSKDVIIRKKCHETKRRKSVIERNVAKMLLNVMSFDEPHNP